jgi:hypothetical protein
MWIICCLLVIQLIATFGVVTGVVLYTRQTIVPQGTAALTTSDGSAVVQTASFSEQAALSSALPNSAFSQMTQFSITSPTGSFLQLSVSGFGRIQGTGQFGSVVQLLTPAGTVTLDGRR